MNKKTVIFLHPHILKPGGATRVVLEQSSRLIKKGLNCIIITTCVDRELLKSYPNLKIIELSKLSTGNIFFWITFPFFYLKLSKTINNIQGNVIYCHSLAIYWGGLYKLLNPKHIVIFYLHDLGFPYIDSPSEISGLNILNRIIIYFIKPFFKLLNRKFAVNANLIVANSLTSAKYFFNNYHRNINHIVKPGIDLNTFKPGGMKSNYVITVGRLDKLKNVNIIIEGFYLFLTKFHIKDYKLLIAGDGPEKTNLQTLCKNLNISNNVLFLGQVKMSQISTYLAKSKVSISMCVFESFGISAAESICCGTPVIGCNENGISEVVIDRKTGLLIDCNPEELANALYTYLGNSDYLNKISILARDYGKNHFAWELQINKLQSIFSSF